MYSHSFWVFILSCCGWLANSIVWESLILFFIVIRFNPDAGDPWEVLQAGQRWGRARYHRWEYYSNQHSNKDKLSFWSINSCGGSGFFLPNLFQNPESGSKSDQNSGSGSKFNVFGSTTLLLYNGWQYFSEEILNSNSVEVQTSREDVLKLAQIVRSAVSWVFCPKADPNFFFRGIPNLLINIKKYVNLRFFFIYRYRIFISYKKEQ